MHSKEISIKKKTWYLTVPWLNIPDKIPGYGTSCRCVGSMTRFVTVLIFRYTETGAELWQMREAFGIKNCCLDARSSGPIISNISLSTQGQQKQNTSFSFISYPPPRPSLSLTVWLFAALSRCDFQYLSCMPPTILLRSPLRYKKTQ